MQLTTCYFKFYLQFLFTFIFILIFIFLVIFTYMLMFTFPFIFIFSHFIFLVIFIVTFRFTFILHNLRIPLTFGLPIIAVVDLTCYCSDRNSLSLMYGTHNEYLIRLLNS